MKKQLVNLSLSGVLFIILTLLLAGTVLANEENQLDSFGMPQIELQEAIFNQQGVQAEPTYSKYVERLDYLNLLPDQEYDWTQDATWKLLADILTKLDAQKPGIIPADLAANASTDALTYVDAAQILIHLLDHGKYADADSIKHLNKLGIKVNKVNIYDTLTGEELAELVYHTLHQKQLNHKKSILEEVFIDYFQLAKQKILQLTSSTIEMEYQGRFDLSSDLTVFQTDSKGTLTPISYSRLTVGMDNAYLIVDSANQVRSIIVEGEYAPRNMRALISSNLSAWGSSSSYEFDSITLAASQPIKVLTKNITGDQLIATIPADQQFSFTASEGQVYFNDQPVGHRVFIESDFADNVTTVYSTTRRSSYPEYPGALEISLSTTPDQMYLVNEVYMEDYLKRVVPSEMPAYWHVEALKVQAISARSYAYNQAFSGRYDSKGANVDDSTSTQVYNNSTVTANVIEAVDATTGLIMTYDGSCITAFFSSTSSGYTASNEEVWHDASTGNFPGVAVPYVRALPQIPNYTYPDFTDEAATLAYFKDVPTQGYDYISPYYRWWIEMTREELENTISKNLVSRERADAILGTDFVQTLEGPEAVGSDFNIGTLLDLKVIRRGAGGNMMTLEIQGTNGTWRVSKEYNIRFVVRPTKAYTGTGRNIILNYHTGGSYTNYTILPSAFASFEMHRDLNGSIVDVTIYGGGNGHGVGMSQWGARGAAEQGRSYEEILKGFYTGIDFTKLW